MTTITLTERQQLNLDVARLVFGIPVCDKPVAQPKEQGLCCLHGTDHTAPDDVRDYVTEGSDDWPGDWDGMRDIIRAMQAKGFGFAMGINSGEAWAGFTTDDWVDGYAESQSAPEAVARAAVAAIKAAKEPQP